jgi:HEPN domain-containing protein
MTPDSGFAGEPEDWLRRARSDLALAKQPKPLDALWEDLCFHAQQGTEKAIKGVLVRRGIEFPKTHDVRSLLSLLEANGEAIEEKIWEAADLTTYAHETRYPGLYDTVTEEDYKQALAVCERVVAWAEALLAKAGTQA